MLRNGLRTGLPIALVTLIADQVTKFEMLAMLSGPAGPRVMVGGQTIRVLDNFNLVLVWNSGVSFGLFGGGPETTRWILIALALALCLGLGVWLRRAASLAETVGLGLVIGGALGNVIDRVYWGAVVDFLDFHAFGYHWPAFNLADTVIFIGVFCLIADGLFNRPASSKR
ncbi:signal peptidase II [Oceanibacterium hippocampi]|uniref:Lipoprotein signal peptidase n=1 Tax=Oceanibacterium hippocampi TaxID=745714 RepID=A0A1Y5S977_9PROT|nr:signal peptidase II [Oceanibacterium hippocampi]SLN32891.1 Lipoprotein signal peptidase [Oceanibacterium hippocampi]